MTRFDQVKRLVDHAVRLHGRIDVIINNAGVMPHSSLERGKVEDWDRMIDVNLKGVLYPHWRCAALHEGAEEQSHHQRFVGGRPQGQSGRRRLCDDKAWRARDFGGTAAGGKAPQHPHDDHLAGRGCDRAARQHHGTRCRRARSQGLRTGDPCRLFRQHGGLRHEPAGGRRSTKSCSGRRSRNIEIEGGRSRPPSLWRTT